jgi:integrase
VNELWHSLFLTVEEVDGLLKEIGTTVRHQFIHPMMIFVAHTGARRSELIRSRIDDFDFETRTVQIREKKRSRKQSITFRRVPMSKLLSNVMQ